MHKLTKLVFLQGLEESTQVKRSLPETLKAVIMYNSAVVKEVGGDIAITSFMVVKGASWQRKSLPWDLKDVKGKQKRSQEETAADIEI